MLKNERFLKDSMDTTYEISNLIKRSPKRDAMLRKIRKNISLENTYLEYFVPQDGQ